ncbi:hypothetical protein PGIGA_G00077500 [Pangasianodon gigas]|uniref:Uncharacterized protein n=1 Tax=Pangasianodon gigas TaxID=30993 RepID=A0ACC5X9Y5_PANGG|nr:hypothetical protein [Pangasianodon gigas]
MTDLTRCSKTRRKSRRRKCKKKKKKKNQRRTFFMLERSPLRETALCGALQYGLNFTAQHVRRAAPAQAPTRRTLMSDLLIPPEGMF